MQSGKAKNVLLIGAEFLTRFVDYTDRGTCVLFGDGAGATVLKATTSDHGVLSTVIRTDGEGACFIIDAGRRLVVSAEPARDARRRACRSSR